MTYTYLEDYDYATGKYTVTILDGKKVVYLTGCRSRKDVEIAKNNFKRAPEMHIDMFKRIEKENRDEIHGNYKHTRYGKIMNKHAEKIQDLTGDVVKQIKIQKSDQSDSRYIELIINNDYYDTYTIRISDHLRRAYMANGYYQDHQYSQEVLVDKFADVNWDKVIKTAVEEIQ